MLAVESKVESGGRDQDRVLVAPIPGGMLLAVSDGAGGWGDGARAAGRVVDALRDAGQRSEVAWEHVLRELDVALARANLGEATAVVVEVRGRSLRGASVGDSAAFLVTDERLDELTRRQRPKPLLGSGRAEPVAFERAECPGRLLLVSDGIAKYVARAELARLAAQGSLSAAMNAVAQGARLPGGGLHDDISIVLCEISASMSAS